MSIFVKKEIQLKIGKTTIYQVHFLGKIEPLTFGLKKKAVLNTLTLVAIQPPPQSPNLLVETH